jgi:hypothetical protein
MLGRQTCFSRLRHRNLGHQPLTDTPTEPL